MFAVLQTFQDLITPADPAQLGIGSDVPVEAKACWESIPDADKKLEVKCVWKIGNRNKSQECEAARQKVAEDSGRVPPEHRKTVELRPAFAAAVAALPLAGELDSSAQEKMLLTGVPVDALPEILNNGMNVRYCKQGNYGQGIYLAEDGAKCDQYTGLPSKSFNNEKLMDRLQYPRPEDHPGDVNYILACRVALGCPVRTNGRGRIPTCLDLGATQRNGEGNANRIYWTVRCSKEMCRCCCRCCGRCCCRCLALEMQLFP